MSEGFVISKEVDHFPKERASASASLDLTVLKLMENRKEIPPETHVAFQEDNNTITYGSFVIGGNTYDHGCGSKIVSLSGFVLGVCTEYGDDFKQGVCFMERFETQNDIYLSSHYLCSYHSCQIYVCVVAVCFFFSFSFFLCWIEI